MTLAQYLAEHHPGAGQPGDSTEDKAIAALRSLGGHEDLFNIVVKGVAAFELKAPLDEKWHADALVALENAGLTALGWGETP